MARTYGTINVEVDAGWLMVRLDRPEFRNALSGEMVEELLQVLNDARNDAKVRAIALRGNGGVFCAGGDLKGFRALFHDGGATEDEIAAYSRRGGELFHALSAMPQLTVALIEGAAIAGGVGLACASDIVIATDGTEFAFSETRLGIPPAQIAPIVAARLGHAKARQLLLLGTRLDAAEAREAGIVDRLVPDASALEHALSELRDDLAKCSGSAIAATKSVLAQAGLMPPDSTMDFAAREFAKCMLSPDGKEGISAFLEKRRPNWT